MIRFSILLCISCLNIISAIYTKKIALRYKDPYLPLYDIIHNTAPKIYYHIPDLLLIVLSIIAIIKSYYMGYDMNVYIDRLIISFGLRTITNISTILPTCISEEIAERVYFSHDLLFSGHTLIYITTSLIIYEHYKNSLFLYIISIISIVSPVTLILARQHYTNDVIIAYIVYYAAYKYIG